MTVADNGRVDEQVRAYIDGIDEEHRPLFDRVHRLILEARPEAEIGFSYKMPTYKAGGHRMLLAVWKHGVSIYGVGEDRDAGFLARRPELKTSRGTIQLRPADAARISDDELRDMARAALGDRTR